MPRDMKLILMILDYVSQSEPVGTGGYIFFPAFPRYEPGLVRHHVKLCEEAGYLETTSPGATGQGYRITRMTWNGYEALEALRKEFSPEI